MERKPIIVGNWKMNNGPRESKIFYKELNKLIGKTKIDVEWAIAPPFVSICSLQSEKSFSLAAQNVNENDSGAFTGEVSVPMLQELSVKYIIIGHSERREFYSETNSLVNKKLKRILETLNTNNKITPIVAYGENEKEFDEGKTLDVVEKQLIEMFVGIESKNLKDIVLAYEPIWAIGTGKTATPEQAQKVIKFSRDIIAKIFNQEDANKIRIQYGGSMNPNNIKDLMKQPDIDGGLVGGASLKPESFYKLITFNKVL